MARETIYVVQAYINTSKGLSPEPAVACTSPEQARRKAEALAPGKAGVVAFATSGDVDLGEYDDEPTVFFKAGRLPPQFENAD